MSRRNAALRQAEERQRLDEAVTAYRTAAKGHLDEHGGAVLDRLIDDSRAAEVFAAIAGDDHRMAAAILTGCIEAEVLSRTFLDRLKVENEMETRLDKLACAVEDLKTFLADVQRGPVDRLSAWIVIDPADAGAAHRGLYVMESLIDSRRRIAAETPARLGATQKSKTQDAAITTAIGWLGEAVLRISGKPHTESTRVLAEIALGIGEVSDFRGREALRTRREREWRMPLGWFKSGQKTR